MRAEKQNEKCRQLLHRFRKYGTKQQTTTFLMSTSKKYNDDDLISSYQPFTALPPQPPLKREGDDKNFGKNKILQGSVVAVSPSSSSPQQQQQQLSAADRNNNAKRALLLGSTTASSSTSEKNYSNNNKSFHVIPAGTSQEAMKTLCVRLVKDKMSLERKISELQDELKKEERIVTDLQTKFATLASTTVVMVDENHELQMRKRQQQQQRNYDNNENHHHSGRGTTGENSTSGSTTPPPGKNQKEEVHDDEEGGVSKFFKSVIDRASALPTLNTTTTASDQAAAAAASTTMNNNNKFAHGNMSLTAEEWSAQCDELLNLNEDLHMQLFEVKQTCDQKVRELQKNSTKKESQLRAEVESLREQLSITQENLVAQVKKATEQEARFEQAGDAVKMFRSLTSRLAEVERRNATRFGYSTTTSRKRIHEEHKEVENDDKDDSSYDTNDIKLNGVKWRSASRAFMNLLETMIRRIETGSTTTSTTATKSAKHAMTESKLAFHIQTLLQQWGNLEDIYEYELSSSSSSSAAEGVKKNLALLQRTRSSMIHVIRNCSTFVMPILLKLIAACFVPPSSSSASNSKTGDVDDDDDTESRMRRLASSSCSFPFDPSSPEMTSCIVSSLQECCDAVSTWIVMIDDDENSTTSSSSQSLLLPAYAKTAIDRFCDWMMMVIGKLSVDRSGIQKEEEEDSSSSNLFDFADASSRSFLELVESFVHSLRELPSVRNSSNNNCEKDSSSSSFAVSNNIIKHDDAFQSETTRKLLAQSDPHHIYLSLSNTITSNDHNSEDEDEALLQSLRRNNGKHRQPSHKRNVNSISTRTTLSPSSNSNNSTNDNCTNDSSLQRLLRQALLDCDALIVQKEQLLLERRDLTVRCESLLDANKRLSSTLKYKDAEHQDTIDTLHHQIEILSEALTESHTTTSTGATTSSINHHHHHDNDESLPEAILTDHHQNNESFDEERRDDVLDYYHNDNDDNDQLMLMARNKKNRSLKSSISTRVLDGDSLLKAYEEGRGRR